MKQFVKPINIKYIYRRALWLLLIAAAFFVSGCNLSTARPIRQGAVLFYNDIPDECRTTRGLRQPVVRRVTSEKELKSHYGMTFKVHFNDKISPALYGTLYYQNEKENIYCMALPDGRFAVFSDSGPGNASNVIQDVCYPIQECN